jgi:hypothetical protein
MKRLLLALPLFVLAAAPALAAGTTVTNHSGLPIDELFASAHGAKAFGGNLMDGIAEGALDDGKTVEVANLADGSYDLKLSAPDEGVLCTIPDVKIEGGKVELTAEMGKACK